MGKKGLSYIGMGCCSARMTESYTMYNERLLSYDQRVGGLYRVTKSNGNFSNQASTMTDKNDPHEDEICASALRVGGGGEHERTRRKRKRGGGREEKKGKEGKEEEGKE